MSKPISLNIWNLCCVKTVGGDWSQLKEKVLVSLVTEWRMRGVLWSGLTIYCLKGDK